MSQQLRGFFKRITGDQASYDALAKPPIADAETKLKLFNDATSISVAALESYLKSMSKLIDQTLSERFSESKELFARYDKPQDQVYGTVLGKLSLVQGEMNNDVSDFVRNVEANVLRPLMDYQVTSDIYVGQWRFLTQNQVSQKNFHRRGLCLEKIKKNRCRICDTCSHVEPPLSIWHVF